VHFLILAAREAHYAVGLALHIADLAEERERVLKCLAGGGVVGASKRDIPEAHDAVRLALVLNPHDRVPFGHRLGGRACSRPALSPGVTKLERSDFVLWPIATNLTLCAGLISQPLFGVLRKRSLERRHHLRLA
jgi:hypothetical protein